MTENELEIQIRWLRDSMDAALNRYKSTNNHMMRTFWYSMYEGYARLYHELCEKLHRLNRSTDDDIQKQHETCGGLQP